METIFGMSLMAAAVLSSLIWLLQQYAFRVAGIRGLFWVVFGHFILSVLIVFGLLYTIDGSQLDGPQVFGAAILWGIITIALLLSFIFNLVTAILLWWSRR